MSFKPWMTSADLINAVQRKIAVPLNQRTFSAEDILAFANEEMMISQVPDIMIFHEEYFVYSENIPLVANQTRYPVPERALGLKLRDIFYVDTNDNLFEMTRINPNDKAYFQSSSGTSNVFQKYYLEGNDVVLAIDNLVAPSGSLRFSYFLRPNQLVLNNRAAICQSFYKTVTLDNSTLVAGDTITIDDTVFTAVASAPAAQEFVIGANSIATATNLVNAINTEGSFSANAGTPASNIISIFYDDVDVVFQSSNATGIDISDQLGIKFTDDLPDNIVDGIKIDFLQTKPGHKTLGMAIKLPINSVSNDSILFQPGVIPSSFEIGDYVCEEYECIIPQIPSDLHNGLAERVCGRILSAQGDMQGLQMTAAKLQDIKQSEGTLLDNRVEGSTQKIGQRKGLISWMRMGVRRRI